MEYLVSFYENGINAMNMRAMSNLQTGGITLKDKDSLLPLKALSASNLDFKSGEEITNEDFGFRKVSYYSIGNCKKFDTFSEAIEFYTAVTAYFSSVILATMEGNIICEYHLSDFGK